MTAPRCVFTEPGSPSELFASEWLDALAEALAERLVPLLDARRSEPAAAPAVTVRDLAGLLGVSRAYVYEHAAELGGWRLPSGGPRPHWRFDVDTSRAALARLSGEGSEHRGSSVPSGDPEPRAERSPRRLPNPLPKPGGLLAPRPVNGGADHATQ